MPVFALVDVNNFFASCEKVFDPALSGRPLVILSNNDGCVIARSPEAKALGVAMGVPWFRIRATAQRLGIVARSSNYGLYADMSNRVAEILNGFSPRLEVYSIDEAFLDLTALAEAERLAQGTRIRRRILDWLGLTVCVGIGVSKTLAKLANHCAKKGLAGEEGVCDFGRIPEPGLSALLERISVGEVWGVGRRLAPQLEAMGIVNCRQLRDADPRRLKRCFSVLLERTICELRGTACLELQELRPDQQQIMYSRSFGRAVETLAELQQVVAVYTARAGEKLRRQGALAGTLTLFLQTYRHLSGDAGFQRVFHWPLPEPTDDSRQLVAQALQALAAAYRTGQGYQKAGVMLSQLAQRRARQGELFPSRPDEARSDRLMQVCDAINRRWGQGALRLAAELGEADWRARSDYLSPAYTRDWTDLPLAKA